MMVHWGTERWTRPNGRQWRLAMGSGDTKGLLESGVDVILGAHPHVVQPAYRVKVQTESGSRDAYVVYSLGNFVQAASHPWPQDSGLVVYVHLEKLGDETTVTGLSFLPVMRQTADSSLTIRLLPVLPGLTPQSDIPIYSATKARMEKVWDYYQGMYDKPEENIVPLDPESLGAMKE
jgi:poly-gamma-glutamate synthesis protein (capsule biosynthesis protein)